MSPKMLSLYIPRVHSDITKEDMAYIFKSLLIGDVSRIDFVSREDSNTGMIYNIAFVHFKEFYKNVASDNFQKKVRDPNQTAKIVHDDPWYWLCLPNINPKPDTTTVLEARVADLEDKLDKIWQAINMNKIQMNMFDKENLEEKGESIPPPPKLVRQKAHRPLTDDDDDEDLAIQQMIMNRNSREALINNAGDRIPIGKRRGGTPPIELPLHEGQIERDRFGELYAFSNVDGVPTWNNLSQCYEE